MENTPSTSANPLIATTKSSIVSTSVAAAKTTPNASKNSSIYIPE
ncbi:hypothetical protein NIES2104_26590 [Leptolyngbya sp. NIES-2104]|nr:hypothetical protein NIES2104_26590 [Leptolyngbya sp. NIES-2104]